MKLCDKENCTLPSIQNRKYCDIHCIRRQRKNKLIPSIKPNNHESKQREEDIDIESRRLIDRMLIDEQNLEYEENYLKDLSNEILKNERQNYAIEMETKKKSLIDDSNKLLINNSSKEDVIKIKFKLPNNITFLHCFRNDSNIRNLFEILDVMLFGMCERYDIILYPSTTIKRDLGNIQLREIGIMNMCLCFIKDLDK